MFLIARLSLFNKVFIYLSIYLSISNSVLVDWWQYRCIDIFRNYHVRAENRMILCNLLNEISFDSRGRYFLRLSNFIWMT
jgi:hypothetical protein